MKNKLFVIITILLVPILMLLCLCVGLFDTKYVIELPPAIKGSLFIENNSVIDSYFYGLDYDGGDKSFFEKISNEYVLFNKLFLKIYVNINHEKDFCINIFNFNFS